MNPCSVAAPQQDIEGDGRWNSIVSFVFYLFLTVAFYFDNCLMYLLIVYEINILFNMIIHFSINDFFPTRKVKTETSFSSATQFYKHWNIQKFGTSGLHHFTALILAFIMIKLKMFYGVSKMDS